MSRSSKRWLDRQRRDRYVKQSQSEGFRSRAAYKLADIDQRLHLFRARQSVLDLGAAPGSWSQYAAQRVGHAGTVIAVDLLPMEDMPGVKALAADVLDPAVQNELLGLAPVSGFDLVLSDMAPNLSGIRIRDQADSLELAGVAVALAQRLLRTDGALLVKLFQGEGTKEWMDDLRTVFVETRWLKPPASRDESREVYAWARYLRVVPADGPDSVTPAPA